MASDRKYRVTVESVAERAGVSTATVDRVLNQRSGVRRMTAKRVLQAASELGYIDEYDGATLELGPKARIAFLLPKGTNRYINMLGRTIVGMTDEFAKAGMRPTIEYISSFNADALAKAMRRQAKTADGLAIMAIDHPSVREMVNRLAQEGKPIATVISDTTATSRVAYFGLDNRAAGRMAGYLIGRFLPGGEGKVAMVAGSRTYRAHGDREMGFMDINHEMFPGVEVVDVREGQDDDQSNYHHVRSLLTQHPDIRAIYNIGGAATGVGKALRYMKRNKDVVFVGHGLTDDTREMLLDGTMSAVITQDAVDTVTRCIRLFSDIRSEGAPPRLPEPMRIEVVFRENLATPRF
ncbi:MAG: LacI family DNA-binding transcriptional regulator [Marinosulfonomonas sp.]